MNTISTRSAVVSPVRSGNLSASDSPSESSDSESSRLQSDSGSSALLNTLDSISRQAAVKSAIANDTDGLQAIESEMQKGLQDAAQDPDKFHEILQKSFGPAYDKAGAEAIRQQVLDNDFSWMPAIRVVDATELQDQSGQQGNGQALGAYSKDTDTIYISRQLLNSDPAKAVEILTEEVGHSLDARLNSVDAAGDEGDIFSRLVNGETIEAAELTRLKSENDTGTIVVDGKEVEVEYGFFSKVFKGIKKAVKGAWDGVKDVAKAAWNGVKKIGKKILESKLISTIMMVAQFIPIPIVQLVARVYNLAKSAYQVGMGIKHGSVGMVLGGVAGVAGGAAGVGKMLGASSGFVSTATKIANGARTAGAAYMAVSQKNFAAAAGLAGQAFGGKSTSVGNYLGVASTVANGVEKYKQGDILGAFRSGQTAYSDITDTGSSADSSDHSETGSKINNSGIASGIQGLVDRVTGSKTYQAIVDNVDVIQQVIKSVKGGDIQSASQTFLSHYADDLGIGHELQQDINKWAGVLDQVHNTVELVNDKDYSASIIEAADLLGMPLTSINQKRLETVFNLRDSVLGRQYANASRQAALLSMQSGQSELAGNFLKLANFLDGNSKVEQSDGRPVAQAAA